MLSLMSKDSKVKKTFGFIFRICFSLWKKVFYFLQEKGPERFILGDYETFQKKVSIILELSEKEKEAIEILIKEYQNKKNKKNEMKTFDSNTNPQYRYLLAAFLIISIDREEVYEKDTWCKLGSPYDSCFYEDAFIFWELINYIPIHRLPLEI